MGYFVTPAGEAFHSEQLRLWEGGGGREGALRLPASSASKHRKAKRFVQ